MSRSEAATAVALVLVEAREKIAHLEGELEAANQHVKVLQEYKAMAVEREQALRIHLNAERQGPNHH
jgi:hypothetical protein